MGFSSASAGAEVEVVVVARGRSTPFVDLSLSKAVALAAGNALLAMACIAAPIAGATGEEPTVSLSTSFLREVEVLSCLLKIELF